MQNQNEFQINQGIHLSNNKKILIVDDDQDNIEILNLFLSHLGHSDITHCYNGKQAYEFLTREAFDLAFLDVRMPVWDGYQTLEMLRQYKLENSSFNTTIIVVSANSFQEDIEKSKSFGAQFHISKPISIKSIQSLLEKIEKD